MALFDESHLPDVGDEREPEAGVGPVAGGPIDEKCLADEVIAGHDPLPIGGITVAFAGSIPKTRVVTGRTVVAHHEKFIISQGDGMVFGA